MLVVSNTSPLLYLYRTGHLELLRQLYGQVHLPPAVQSELAAGADQGIAVPSPSDYAWISILRVKNPQLMPMIKDLGAGETEAIALGLEHPGSLVILDDQLGRKIARASGLRVTGTLGVVLKGKRAGLLSSVAIVVDELRGAGLWIGDELARDVVAEAGEHSDG